MSFSQSRRSGTDVRKFGGGGRGRDSGGRGGFAGRGRGRGRADEGPPTEI